MQIVALLCACLAFASDGRRFQQQFQDDSVEDLASILLASTPTRALSTRTVRALSEPHMRASEDNLLVETRRAVLAGLLGMGVSSGATPAFAGRITKAKPQDAEIDDDLIKSGKVQGSLKKIKGYKAATASLKSQFDSNTNLNLIPTIRKDLDVSELRNDLNNVGTAFDDETQQTTDRILRAILYDVTELENVATPKKGAEINRSAKRIKAINQWFSKIDNDLTDFLSYVPQSAQNYVPPTTTSPPTTTEAMATGEES
jgi:hypothetical protein